MKNSSTWVEYKNDLFDDYGGMDSGSHLLTLGRLYAWEKKLFEEVKVCLFYNSLCLNLYFRFYDDDTASICILEWIKITVSLISVLTFFFIVHFSTYYSGEIKLLVVFGTMAFINSSYPLL